MSRRFDENVFHGRWSKDIPALLALDEVEPDLFRSRDNQRNAYGALFGGQIVAQALAAADLTAADRAVHSLHAYFLRPGVDSEQIDYRVERLRDGRRFSTRRVSAYQRGALILTLECSYRVPMEGFDHFRPTRISLDPEGTLDSDVFEHWQDDQGRTYGALFGGHYPVDVRLPGKAGFLERDPSAKRHYWLRAPGAEHCEDAAVHRQILTFLSDFMFVGAPLAPHTVALPGPHLFVASLDHCMWFHREVRCDDWLLFETEGPNAHGGVNLARGFVYNRAGELVASMTQEALQYPVEAED